MRLTKALATVFTSNRHPPMKPSMDTISKFKQAMNAVYGPIPDHNPNASSWQPPENSGGHRGRYLW